MLIRKKAFPIIAPGVNNPPSRNAWKPIIFMVIGRSNSATRPILFLMIRPRQIMYTTVMIHIIYPAFVSMRIKLYASAVLYISGVGGGNIPNVPNIGIIRINDNTIFKMMLIIFFHTNIV